MIIQKIKWCKRFFVFICDFCIVFVYNFKLLSQRILETNNFYVFFSYISSICFLRYFDGIRTASII